MTDTPKLYSLECGHILRLITPPISLEEFLYCKSCAAYMEIAPAASKLRGVWVIHTDENFRSKRLDKSHYMGECSEDGCNETITKRSWFTLRDHFHSHLMRKHRGRDIQIGYADKIRKGDPPPF